MKKFKFKSLTMRIWATFTTIILLIVCSISLLYMVAYRKISENAKVQDLKVAHDILLKNDNFSQPFNRFSELRNLRGGNSFILVIGNNNVHEIVDISRRPGMVPGNGTAQNQYPYPGVRNREVEPWIAGLYDYGNAYEKQYQESYNGTKILFIVSTIKYGSSGKAYLISYAPDVQDNTVLYIVSIIGMIFIVIGFFTAKVVAGRISKPLKELEDFTKRIAKKDWKEPITVNSQDEIGRLAESMNSMQRELKRADEEEKMFLQSISHDLKTPVMVIMSHAEAIRDGIYVESAEKTAEIIRDEAINLEKRIKQLLYLNTLDYVMEQTNDSGQISLHELLLNIISRLKAVNNKIEWDVEVDEIFVKGNEEKIKVSFENILDNALRYAETKICVTLKRHDHFAVVKIYNDGPNIADEHIEQIFDSFYKDKTGNFGLGLAISKKIVDFHKGQIKAVNRDKGVTFIIKYPL